MQKQETGNSTNTMQGPYPINQGQFQRFKGVREIKSHQDSC